MNGLAHVTFASGYRVLPAREPYDRERLVEQARWKGVVHTHIGDGAPQEHVEPRAYYSGLTVWWGLLYKQAQQPMPEGPRTEEIPSRPCRSDEGMEIERMNTHKTSGECDAWAV